jgi:fumarate reductase iron-sulfur subunit
MPPVIELFPLPFFKMLGDLSVDTGVWFREIAEKLESWIHTDEKFNPKKEEKRMANELAGQIYEHDRCIECGCCIAGCATINVKPDFLGAAGLNRIARYMIDPRDERDPETWYELVSTYEGVFGCIGMMACDDVCPKNIPLLETFSRVRRLMISTGIFGKREMLTVKR